MSSKTPYGYCECGCGEKTRIAPQTRRDRNWIKGQPLRFRVGHRTRLPGTKHHLGHSHSDESKALISQNPAWQGGRRMKDGYVLALCPEHPHADFHGYVREHRLVMEEAIGRFLEPEEVVHHMLECEGGSGLKDDNRIGNLMLFSDHGSHMQHHAAIEGIAGWVR